MQNRTKSVKTPHFNPFYSLGHPLTLTFLWFLHSLIKLNQLLIACRLSLFAHLKPQRPRGRPPKKKPLSSLVSNRLVGLTKSIRSIFPSPSLSSLAHHLSKNKFLKIKLHRATRRGRPRKQKPTTIYQRSFASRFFFNKIGLTSLIIILALTLGSSLFYFEILKDLPHPTDLATKTPVLTTKIYDRHGNLLYKIFQNENRTLTSLDDIPIYLQQATIAIEDQNFYQHSGFSLRGIIRAFKTNIQQDSMQGGSTITQQLIKNTLLTPEKTFTRKIKELVLSVLTEFYFTKDEILTMYFNQVPYGGAAYGVEEASQMFFGKSVKYLTLAEAAFLAGLPAAPTRYSPYGTKPELAVMRQHQVLRRMVEDGHISLQQAEDAKAQKIVILPQQNTIEAPHFVMYIKDILVDKYGLAAVEQGGLEVTTSLDLNIQQSAQAILTTEVNQLSRLRVTNGAALVTNPKTGEILAMVGSKDYFDTKSDGQVNVTIRPRQPGSSIKPINYATALERGFTPATIIQDTPICYNLPGQPPYCPRNYDNTYHGNVTVRQALANSYNIPAVKTLSQIGVATMIDKARLMGITTWGDTSRFGLSLTLGGGEVKMTDMAVAYGSFANLGYRVDLHPILKVTNYDGKTLEKFNCKALTNSVINPVDPVSANTTETTCNGTHVLDPRVAYQITDILSDNLARSRAFGLNSVLNIPGQQVAVKTGTTNSLRDNWTFGYTNNYLVATWVGNNDNTPMSYIASGITGASPIWQKIMLTLLDKDHPSIFEPPTNLTKVKICTLTGTLACNGCPSKEEYFLPGTEPTNHCTEDWINQIKQNYDSSNPNRDRLLQGISTQDHQSSH